MNYMRRALDLANQAFGSTSPNPPVGAVVVKSGHIIGEGVTQEAGGDHAEIVALKKARSKAKNSVLYTTLEPCCIQGRTPPCTNAIIEFGVREIHVAALDPNPKVNGNGVRQLREAGVTVHIEAEMEETKELYEGFAKHVNIGVPFVTAKFAISLDGKIATHNGDSKWITSEESRRQANKLRMRSDAIMVGINTVIKDNPRLTARDSDGSVWHQQPLRVIVDSHCRTPNDSKLLHEPGKTLIATTTNYHTPSIYNNASTEIIHMSADQGKVDLELLLVELGNRGVVNLLVEGGGILLGSLFDKGLVDKILAFVGPIIVGGAQAPSPVGGKGASQISHALRLKNVSVLSIGDDILIKGYK